MFDHMLVPIDGSPCSQDALDRALALAAILKSRVTICHVVDESKNASMLVYASGEIVQEWYEMLRHDAQELVGSAVARATNQGIAADLRVLGGDPSDAIAACAADAGADLIVIGSHGRSGLPRLFLGSVAEGVLRKSPVPVLVIREARAPASADSAKADEHAGPGATGGPARTAGA